MLNKKVAFSCWLLESFSVLPSATTGMMYDDVQLVDSRKAEAGKVKKPC
jgi:hypothetical protein